MSPSPARTFTGRRARVKMLMGKVPSRYWLRQLPHGEPVWGDCAFLFDPDARDYDWLVVYDDLPPVAGERFSDRCETLACARANTLLITTEPSSIKAYGSAYTRQFGQVLTSQEPWALGHPRRIYSQPAMQWFYGVGPDRLIGYDTLAAATPPAKTGDVSTICSTKQQRHTLHQRRYAFTQELKGLMPELTVFGRGVRPVGDKAEAIDPFRYHIAIENQFAPHHFTEKLADTFLGFALPFYHGCPNWADYFPEESIIPIDVHDTQGALETIQRAVRDGEYARRLPHIVEARRRVLEQYNTFATVAAIIAERGVAPAPTGRPARILARHALRRRNPLTALRMGLEKAWGRVNFALRNR
ncbi:MAG: glycosyltransferase [Nitrospirae bacterium]|nr:glycosyltransferase [Nitrospirota bacterium]